MRTNLPVTATEHVMRDDQLIVSKTDLKGRITHFNQDFVDISGFSEQELLGAPQNIIRHPDMPRSVFALLWEAIQNGREMFAYIKNMTKRGDHYWVLAHVTPSRDAEGRLIGFHSNRRVPGRKAVERIEQLYDDLRRAEAAAPGPREAIAAGQSALERALSAAGKTYNQFVFSL